MALNINDSEVERLVDEVAELAGETKTDAIRRALIERRERLKLRRRGELGESFLRYLEEEVWPLLRRRGALGKRFSRKQEDDILGYSEEGV